MEGLNIQNKLSDQEKNLYLENAWQRAEEFSVIRQSLQKEADELYILFTDKPITSLGLHKQDLRREDEEKYWEIKGKIDEIKKQEDELEEIILKIEEGNVSKDEIEKVLPKQTEEEKHLSKRKRRILEEKRRLGIDPREIMSEMYGEFGSEKMHLTTGRHGNGVKNLGNTDPLSAAAHFFFATTDTHGGKVAHGKKGGSYVSVSGKRIRKS